jgi:hypothetical protein
MLKTVVSGGQTGIDRMGLEIAVLFDLKTGGWAPKGCRTENGPDPTLLEFGLKESWSFNYDVRTVENIRDSDGTVIFGNLLSPGSLATRSYCVQLKKPCIWNPQSSAELIEFIESHNIEELNVAGNRASKLSTADAIAAQQILTETFKHYSHAAIQRSVDSGTR